MNKTKLTTVFILCFAVITSIQGQADDSPIFNWVIKVDHNTDSIKEIAKELSIDSYEPLNIGTLKGYYKVSFEKIFKTSEIKSRLKSESLIKWSAPDPIVPKVKKNLNDLLLANQWHLNDTNSDIDVDAFEAWALGYSGAGVQICIVDDGLDHSHPDISPNYYGTLSRDYNASPIDSDPTPNSNDAHGTACGGVAAGKGNNGVGISGAAYDANISGIRLIAAGVNNSTEATALTYRLDSNDIYSNSWGPSDDGRYYTRNEMLHLALVDAVKNGRNGLGNIYVWAAGNGRTSNDNVNYDPYASSIYTIAVGAHGDNGAVSWYSEPGASMLISAPSNGGQRGITTSDIVGNNGYSDFPGDDDYTSSFGGTSSACPLASGVIALMLEANPQLTWRDIQHLLVENAVQIDPTNGDWTSNGAGYLINHNYGFGSLDASALVQAAASWQPVPEQLSDTSTILNINEQLSDAAMTNSQAINVSASTIIELEHIELLLDITHSRASDLEIVLTSPFGTQSIMAEQRNLNTQTFGSRGFMSVRNWGESPIGDWVISITDKRSGQSGSWNTAQLILHGNENCSTPSFVSQPKDIFTELGTDTFLHVITDMTLAQTFQWQRDGVDIPNSDNDTLYIIDFDSSDIGDYTAAVTDACKTSYSQEARLDIPCVPLEIFIVPDDYGSEITWSLTKISTGSLLASGGPYTDNNSDTVRVNLCVQDGCFEFEINDSIGDGICCAFGMGSYGIIYADTTILSPSGGQYISQETVSFCICENDSDQDGTIDCVDLCPLDLNKIEPGICGCGEVDNSLPAGNISVDSNSIVAGTYSAADSVKFKGRIPSPNQVIIRYGIETNLLPEFEVEQGAWLLVQQGACN